MNPRKQVTHFATELDKLIDRFRQEYDLTSAEMIGVLQLEIHFLCTKAFEPDKTP